MGAGADYDSLLCVTVGTGIGGALIMDARSGMAPTTAPARSAFWSWIGTAMSL